MMVDQIIELHDQSITEMLRHAKRAYEKKHREGCKRQKKALDRVLQTMDILLTWPDDQPFFTTDVWQCVSESVVRGAVADLLVFKTLEDRGYGDALLSRYPSLHKYFATFLHLLFAAKVGSEPLLEAITIVRQLDAGTLKNFHRSFLPTTFVPYELWRCLSGSDGSIQRNA